MTSGRAPTSIKRRLLVMLLGTVAVVWLATAGYSYWDARHEIDELLDAHLAQSAALLVAQTGHELEEIDVEHAPQLHRYERRVAFQIWERGRTLRLHSANAPNERFSARDEGFSDAVVGDRRWRVFSSWDPKRRFLIQVGEQRSARDEIAARIGRNLLVPLAFALLVLGVLVYLSVSRATRPLANVNRQIAQRDPENLQPIAVDDCPAEVVPLVDGLNRLFGRVTRSIDDERRFTADAAHELRTPIAALRVQAQVARAAADDRERQHALDNVIAGCDRATHLVEQLLTLARLDPAYVRLTARAMRSARDREDRARRDRAESRGEGRGDRTRRGSPGARARRSGAPRNPDPEPRRQRGALQPVANDGAGSDRARRRPARPHRHRPGPGRAGRRAAEARRALLPGDGHGSERERARALDREARCRTAPCGRELRSRGRAAKGCE